jgi:hypothetical protein
MPYQDLSARLTMDQESPSSTREAIARGAGTSVEAPQCLSHLDMLRLSVRESRLSSEDYWPKDVLRLPTSVALELR